jgi:hypothetical protein
MYPLLLLTLQLRPGKQAQHYLPQCIVQTGKTVKQQGLLQTVNVLTPHSENHFNLFLRH